MLRVCLSVALVITACTSHARIIFSSVPCLVVPYLCTLSHNRHEFRDKGIEREMYVWTFSTNFV